MDSRIAGELAAQVKLATSKAITMKELQTVAVQGIRSTMQQVRMWGQGTPARKIKHAGGRKRFVLADGRIVHPTKGIYGSKKHSRRSNRS